MVLDDDCKENESRGLKTLGCYGESCKDIIGKEIKCLGLIAPNEFDEEFNGLVKLKDKNKCLKVTDNLVNEKDEIEGENKRMGLSSLICSGETVNGAKGRERNEINVSSLVNERDVMMNSNKGDWTSNFNKPVDIIKEYSVEQKEGRKENNNQVASDIVLGKFVNEYAQRTECESLSFHSCCNYRNLVVFLTYYCWRQ
nr:hypothetical protein [Tanacetum cinerariifolium]